MSAVKLMKFQERTKQLIFGNSQGFSEFNEVAVQPQTYDSWLGIDWFSICYFGRLIIGVSFVERKSAAN